MISTKTINNQNAIINAVLGTDSNSTTTVNGNLLIQDTNGNSLTINSSGVVAPTNTTLNNLTVNGTSNFNNSVNVNNNTITLTDGTTTNTLNKSDWTGTIKTFNTTTNATHYLNFSDSSATGQGNPQKCNLIS